MASWTKAAWTVMAMAWMLCGIPAASMPLRSDPNKCLDRFPELKCCPSRKNHEIVEFKPQPQPQQLRVRRPAHALDPEAAQKYEKAVALMRALPEDHPWSFIQQAKVHCAYCSGGHVQLGLNITIEIHGSWHFFTWHRAYLYFYERILGKLVGDDSFALPFWNWDDPAGMSIPSIYTDNTSSLFNPTRYPSALNFTDLGSCKGSGSLEKQKRCNLRLVHRQFIAGANSSTLFYGNPLRAGMKSFPGGGSIENSPHSPVHLRTGSDMSQIAKAGFDPLFHVHHSNVDRLWAIWARIPGGNGSKVINDKDFLDASFLFWDENMQLVRIKVRDVVDTRKLGYVYEDVPLQWMNIDATAEDGEEMEKDKRVNIPGDGVREVRFPFLLGNEVSVYVARSPEKSTKKLVVSDIELDGRDYVWFDVYVSRQGGGARVQAGSFIHMERRANVKFPIVTMLQIGITEFLNGINAAGDDLVVVTLAPKVGGEKVRIGGISII